MTESKNESISKSKPSQEMIEGLKAGKKYYHPVACPRPSYIWLDNFFGTIMLRSVKDVHWTTLDKVNDPNYSYIGWDWEGYREYNDTDPPYAPLPEDDEEEDEEEESERCCDHVSIDRDWAVSPSEMVHHLFESNLEAKLGFDLTDLDIETTPDMAKKLAKEFGGVASFWLNAFKLWEEFGKKNVR